MIFDSKNKFSIILQRFFVELTIASIIVCNTMAITIKREPEGEKWVNEGQSVEQACVFDVPVHCAWYKNGSHIKISDRYRYINRKIKEKSEDCSITISPFNLNDVGWWSCCNMDDSSGSEVIHSNKTWLGAQGMKIIIHPRANLRVNRGSNVTLDCKFNTKVKCSWKKNTNPIANGFEYLNENYQNTDNCSIVLINVGEMHEGKWRCQNMVSDTINHSVTSFTAEITVENPMVVTQPQSQTYTKLGERVYLNCTFNMPVNCYWAINNIEAEITDDQISYSQNNGIDTKDCNITIYSLKLSNIGNWICADKDMKIASQSTKLQFVNQLTNITCHCSSHYIDHHNCENALEEKPKKASLQFEEIRCMSTGDFPRPKMYWKIDNIMASPTKSYIVIKYKISTIRTNDGFWNSTLSMPMELYHQLNMCFNSYSLSCVVVHIGYENENKTLKIGNVKPDNRVNATPPIINVTPDTACKSCGEWIAVAVIFIIITVALIIYMIYYRKNQKKQEEQTVKSRLDKAGSQLLTSSV